MFSEKIPKATRLRFPVYLNYLQSLKPNAPLHISSSSIACALGMGEVQVRKDLALVPAIGKPKIGYVTDELINCLKSELGYDNITNAVIVGAGKLGKALLGYTGFQNYGLNIISAFDVDPSTFGQTTGGKYIFDLSDFSNYCQGKNIKIGIITVPSSKAQFVCDLMVKNEILAIWNFAPIHLNVPEYILVQNENMASSLALLSEHLTKKLTNSSKTINNI